MDTSALLRLYDDCLRADEGIRYRRSGNLPPQRPPNTQFTNQETVAAAAVPFIMELARMNGNSGVALPKEKIGL